jgi:hypothetical protein
VVAPRVEVRKQVGDPIRVERTQFREHGRVRTGCIDRHGPLS